MNRYACMPRAVISRGQRSIVAVQRDHIEAIRQWRNAQLDVLRQSAPISPEQQQRYYDERISPTLPLPNPDNILVSYLVDGDHVGYGGLVHIDWPGNHAEVSFLLDPSLIADEATYRDCHIGFLELVEELAFDDLGLDYLTTETYAHRVGHIANLEAAGFVRTEVIPSAVEINGVLTDSIMHRCDRPGTKE